MKENLARALELLDKSEKLAGVLIAQHGVGPLLSLLLEAKGGSCHPTAAA